MKTSWISAQVPSTKERVSDSEGEDEDNSVACDDEDTLEDETNKDNSIFQGQINGIFVQ